MGWLVAVGRKNPRAECSFVVTRPIPRWIFEAPANFGHGFGAPRAEKTGIGGAP